VPTSEHARSRSRFAQFDGSQANERAGPPLWADTPGVRFSGTSRDSGVFPTERALFPAVAASSRRIRRADA
jgi:hypothetical protein